MSRAMPSECDHGRIFDWGDFGGEDSKPEPCAECDNEGGHPMIDRDFKDQLREAIALYRNKAFVVLDVSPELRILVEAAEAYQSLTGGEGSGRQGVWLDDYDMDDE